ncbi:polyadenylate-binding protein-interacting protein 11-like isoform X2 [Magnolia sinica]|uniref:polyadenylate-binding protein-interacting protein 11-like isoform X2 n=1 Tax=Magnolia sinica TaxID=86752 RepID=UPI00265AAD2B|nr:polyadenylate-binding protein-interacting protein 11-like isoform X2 [Magnolia sinica]
MAVVDNAGIDRAMNVGSSSRNFEAAAPNAHGPADVDQPKPNHLGGGVRIVDPNMHPSFHMVQQLQQLATPPAHVSNHKPQQVQQQNIEQGMQQVDAVARSNGVDLQRNGEVGGKGFKQDMRALEELLSKLNPMAEEFVPPSLVGHGHVSVGGLYSNGFAMMHPNGANGVGPGNVNNGRRRKNGYGQGKRRMNSRTSMAQREEIIRRTVYVCDIDQQVTEEQLAGLFQSCGQVVDCRICGDPNSVLRFAFIEFTDEEGARAALSLAGTMLGYYPVRVLPSKTAIAPVNPTFLPRSEDEREMCARTIYCTNIDKKVTQADVKLFFETICGEVYRLRLLGDYHHSTRIAFVEFVMVRGKRFSGIH